VSGLRRPNHEPRAKAPVERIRAPTPVLSNRELCRSIPRNTSTHARRKRESPRRSTRREMVSMGQRFRIQMEPFSTAAKVTQARYGVIIHPAHRDSRKKRTTVHTRVPQRRRISRKAHPGERAQKKKKDQRKFRKSWRPKAVMAFPAVSETGSLRHTRKKAIPIIR
jgi:hypothetical protein